MNLSKFLELVDAMKKLEEKITKEFKIKEEFDLSPPDNEPYFSFEVKIKKEQIPQKYRDGVKWHSLPKCPETYLWIDIDLDIFEVRWGFGTTHIESFSV